MKWKAIQSFVEFEKIIWKDFERFNIDLRQQIGLMQSLGSSSALAVTFVEVTAFTAVGKTMSFVNAFIWFLLDFE